MNHTGCFFQQGPTQTNFEPILSILIQFEMYSLTDICVININGLNRKTIDLKFFSNLFTNIIRILHDCMGIKK